MSQYFTYTKSGYRGIAPAYLTMEEIDRFNATATDVNLLSQREVDEREVGRRFANAREWIEYTLATKGEGSGRRFMVEVTDSSNVAQSCFYTQTRDYHSSGGEDLLQKKDGSWGCERFRTRSDDELTLHRGDIERARTLQTVVASVKRRSTSNQTTEVNGLRQLNPPPGLANLKHIRSGAHSLNLGKAGVLQSQSNGQSAQDGYSSCGHPNNRNIMPPRAPPMRDVNHRTEASSNPLPDLTIWMSPCNSRTSWSSWCTLFQTGCPGTGMSWTPVPCDGPAVDEPVVQISNEEVPHIVALLEGED